MTSYQAIDASHLEEIKALYAEHGWSAYLGDGQHCVLVQDLIVAAAYTRQGLGRALMAKVFDEYASVRWVQVNTDVADERANAFYQALGMKKLEAANVVSYYRSTRI